MPAIASSLFSASSRARTTNHGGGRYNTDCSKLFGLPATMRFFVSLGVDRDTRSVLKCFLVCDDSRADKQQHRHPDSSTMRLGHGFGDLGLQRMATLIESVQDQNVEYPRLGQGRP